MDGLKCPKCGATNYPGLMGFPRCHRCHEQLRQCRYCAHQECGLCRLEAVRQPPLQEERGKPYCRAFESALGAGEDPGPWRQPVVGQVWVLGTAAVLAVVAAVVVALIVAADPTVDRIDATGFRPKVLDHRVVADFTIRADPDFRDQVRIRIDPRVFEHYDLLTPEPEPLDLVDAPYGYRWEVPNNGKLRVHLTFLARDDAPPEQELIVSVVDPDGQVQASAKTYLYNPQANSRSRPER